MPKIIIQNLYNKEIFTKKEDKSLLDSIHRNHIDWMHACGGKGRCTSCKVEVIEGLHNFPEESKAEVKYRNQNRLNSNQRLTCQSQIEGDVVVKVMEENQFNHLSYSE
jgi:2Fe-2S ferredoxin